MGAGGLTLCFQSRSLGAQGGHLLGKASRRFIGLRLGILQQNDALPGLLQLCGKNLDLGLLGSMALTVRAGALLQRSQLGSCGVGGLSDGRQQNLVLFFLAL